MLCQPPASPSSSPHRVGVPPPQSTLGGGTTRSPANPPGPRRWHQGDLPGGTPLNPRGVPQPPGVGRSRATPPGRGSRGSCLTAARLAGGAGSSEVRGGEALFYPLVIFFF